jgi:hypothetical protein
MLLTKAVSGFLALEATLTLIGLGVCYGRAVARGDSAAGVITAFQVRSNNAGNRIRYSFIRDFPVSDAAAPSQP